MPHASPLGVGSPGEGLTLQRPPLPSSRRRYVGVCVWPLHTGLTLVFGGAFPRAVGVTFVFVRVCPCGAYLLSMLLLLSMVLLLLLAAACCCLLLRAASVAPCYYYCSRTFAPFLYLALPNHPTSFMPWLARKYPTLHFRVTSPTPSPAPAMRCAPGATCRPRSPRGSAVPRLGLWVVQTRTPLPPSCPWPWLKALPCAANWTRRRLPCESGTLSPSPSAWRPWSLRQTSVWSDAAAPPPWVSVTPRCSVWRVVGQLTVCIHASITSPLPTPVPQAAAVGGGFEGNHGMLRIHGLLSGCVGLPVCHTLFPHRESLQAMWPPSSCLSDSLKWSASCVNRWVLLLL